MSHALLGRGSSGCWAGSGGGGVQVGAGHQCQGHRKTPVFLMSPHHQGEGKAGCSLCGQWLGGTAKQQLWEPRWGGGPGGLLGCSAPCTSKSRVGEIGSQQRPAPHNEGSDPAPREPTLLLTGM